MLSMRAASFNDSFAASLANLPNESSPAADEMLASWMGFFGSHYSFGVTMGGQMVMRWTMSSSSYSNLTQHLASEGKTIEAGEEAAFGTLRRRKMVCIQSQ